MLNALVRFALTQRLFVGVLLSIALMMGFLAWKNMPIDAFPDISATQVNLIIKAPGMTAEEIEAQITRPIETELLGIPNQAILRSTTKYSITSITLDFTEQTDIYWARQQVSERLQGLWSTLPTGISGGMAPMSTPLSEMFMFTVENPQLSLQQRKHLLDWQIRPALRTVPGVADVNVLGGYTKTIQFTPDISRLQQTGIGLEDIEASMAVSNLNGAVGRMDVGTESMIIRTEGRMHRLEDVADLIIYKDNSTYRLSDLGQLSQGQLTRYGGVTKDGAETTQGLVVALKDSNTAEVVSAVREKLVQIQATLPEGTDINIFYDRKDLIDTAVGTISSALFQAIFLVAVLLALFLGNFRASLVVAASIPISVILTFYLMSQFGLTANLMSLGGLVIAIGLLVDSAVVVVENTVTALQRDKNLPKLHLIYRATGDIIKPVFAGTLIVIVVFIPLLTLTGLEGKLFTPVALTIVFALLSALLTAITVMPVLASWVISQKRSKPPKYLNKLQGVYQRSLKRVLLAPRWFVADISVVFIASVVLFTFIGKTFMPVLNEGDIIIQLEKVPTINLQSSLQLDKDIEQHLLAEIPEIEQIVARTGSDELGLDPMGLNETDIFLTLKPMKDWRFKDKTQLIDAMRQVLLQYPGINFAFTQPIQMRSAEMLTGSSGTVAIKVFGEDTAVLAQLAEQISNQVKAIEGSVDVQMTLIDGGDYISISLHNELAGQYGLSNQQLAKILRIQVDGEPFSQIIDGKIKTPIYWAYDSDQGERPTSVAELKNLPLLLPDNRLVTLADIATVERTVGPAIIERENGERFSVVAANVQGRDLVGFVEEIRFNVGQNMTLPEGYFITYGGEFENQLRATRNLLTVIPLVLLLIVIILFSTFGNLITAGLILANIPFALMGGVLALFISGEYLSVPASVGFIALLGIAILNGVVLLSHLRDVRFQSRDLLTVILSGSGDRLRPILMTATTAVFGLMPLVLATGPGAEIQKPLAIVVIGGLFTSTLITLYLLPLLYHRIESRTKT
ncbi:MAG: efflux RND transporter permease subunit [Marinicella pacifica]